MLWLRRSFASSWRQVRKTADQSQKALLKAEDALSVLEDREARRVRAGASTMTRRTLSEARESLDEHALGLSDAQSACIGTVADPGLAGKGG